MFVNPAAKALVGCGGFKDAPDSEGVVEIGCEVAPAFRRQGYATEALLGLARFAFTRPQVGAVDACSLPVKGAQSRLLQAIGMTRIGEGRGDDADRVWHWRLTRERFLKSAATVKR